MASIISTSDILKSYAAGTAQAVREKSPGFKRTVARYRAMEMARQSFPNDKGGYIRVEKTEPKIVLKTPAELWRDVYAAFVYPVGLTRSQSPGKPRRQRHSKKRWGIPSWQRKSVEPESPFQPVRLLGHLCRVARAHLHLNGLIAHERSRLPSDLSVNAVESRRTASAIS